MVNALDYFTALVREDDAIPLFEAALAIAQDADPRLDLLAPQTELDLLGSKLARRVPADASQVQKLRILNHFFYRELGFAGNVNDYYNPDNSYLHRVLATRRGIPISLAVLYMELAQYIELTVKGIAFPGHFLMKVPVQPGDVILDPFNGASLSREELEERLEPYFAKAGSRESEFSAAECLREAPPRDILVRMLRNLKALFSAPPNWVRLLDIQQRLLVLLPDDVVERRDRGLTYANLERPQAAATDLESYLEARPDALDAEEMRTRLSALHDASRKAS